MDENGLSLAEVGHIEEDRVSDCVVDQEGGSVLGIDDCIQAIVTS